MSHADFPDPSVWDILFSRQMDNLRHKACPAFFEGITALGLSAGEVPTLTGLSERLCRINGWQIMRVPGIVAPGDFLDLLANRIFPSTYFLRSMAQLDYLEEPDMFHDIFGHLPLLANPAFSEFYQRLGQLGAAFSDNQPALECIERFYWYTVEFGLVRAGGDLQLYGSGLLSSFGESRQVFGKGTDLRPFHLDEIIHLPFDKSHMQPLYYVIPDFPTLFGQIGLLENRLSAFRFAPAR